MREQMGRWRDEWMTPGGRDGRAPGSRRGTRRRGVALVAAGYLDRNAAIGGLKTPAVLAAIVLMAVTPRAGVAQRVLEIDDRIGCAGCTIETGPPVTLAAPKDHVWFTSTPPPLVARDSDGNYIASRIGGDAVIAAFDAEGTFRSSTGRYGEGPGEFAGPPMAMAIGTDDVLYAFGFDALHTFSPQAARFRERVRLPVVANAAVILNSGVAVQAPIRTEAGITTVQILQPDGTIQASIVVAERKEVEGPIENDLDLRRVIGRSNDHGDVWTALIDRYQVSRYGPNGEEKTRIERVSDRFPPYAGTWGGLGSVILQDGDGLLWILIGRRVASDSSPANERRPGVEGGSGDRFADLNQVWRVTVEVLDPIAGELVARREFDEFMMFVSTPGDDVFVYSLYPDELGYLDCVIRPLRLRRE